MRVAHPVPPNARQSQNEARALLRIASIAIGVALPLSGCVARQPVVTSVPAVPVHGDSLRLTAPPPPIAVRAVVDPTPRQLVLFRAEQMVGTRYRYGGDTPERGFDCSGFVRWLYSQQGIDLPRTARAMSVTGTHVPARRAQLLPGDLLFFAEAGKRVSHVAIYVGEGRIVHASSGQGAVRYDDLDSARGRWFRRHVVSARRVLETE